MLQNNFASLDGNHYTYVNTVYVTERKYFKGFIFRDFIMNLMKFIHLFAKFVLKYKKVKIIFTNKILNFMQIKTSFFWQAK